MIQVLLFFVISAKVLLNVVKEHRWDGCVIVDVLHHFPLLLSCGVIALHSHKDGDDGGVHNNGNGCAHNGGSCQDQDIDGVLELVVFGTIGSWDDCSCFGG